MGGAWGGREAWAELSVAYWAQKAGSWLARKRQKCLFLVEEIFPPLRMGTSEEYGLIPFRLLWKQGKNKPNNVPIDNNTLEKFGHKADESFNLIYFFLSERR